MNIPPGKKIPEGHTEDCYRVAVCTVCDRKKSPVGRDAPAMSYGSYCAHECKGHFQEPLSGDLWPGEYEDIEDDS